MCVFFLFLTIPVLSRIKTNGSLPRNETRRSVQSPVGAVAVGRNLNSSEDELSGIFTFDPTPNSLPPSPSVSSSNHHQTSMVETAPASCKSPYENVCMPQSPRTRIRTTLGKNKEESPDSSSSLSSAQHTYQLITSGVAAEVFSFTFCFISSVPCHFSYNYNYSFSFCFFFRRPRGMPAGWRRNASKSCALFRL